ncbi:MAG TPA: glycosyltransferase family 1 protein [Ktedonobacteraceae bacterium]|nr:glycosyltransferase family 1 protein [Ktedonobacteraceae bacterium]
MHIGINAQLLSFSQNYRNGGVSRYIRYLLTGLAKDPGQHQYTVFVNGEETAERLPSHPQITYVPEAWGESNPASRVAWEQLTLPTIIRQKQIDVLHSPVNVLPERLPQNCAGVITLHDLAFLRFPRVLTRSKRLYHRTFTVRSLRRATLIMTVSESTRQDAITLVGVDPEQVRTVYLCIDERFSEMARTVEESAVTAFREKYGLSQGFVLYLGTLEPRKNITTLIDAYAHLRKHEMIQEKLVLAGGKGWLYDKIFEKVQHYGLESEVFFPGFVTDVEQPLWYRAASTFVYPSLYEGFGMPVAEALASGTPVVTSNVSSLPEAGDGVALSVNPNDVDALSDAIAQTLKDPSVLQNTRAQAARVAEDFSQGRMVSETRAAYEQAAELHASRGGTKRTIFVP